MSLDQTSCHWVGLHVIGSDFMSLGRTSCYWIGLHVIGSDFMSLDVISPMISHIEESSNVHNNRPMIVTSEK